MVELLDALALAGGNVPPINAGRLMLERFPMH